MSGFYPDFGAIGIISEDGVPVSRQSLGSFNTTASQDPTGLGDANKIQISFGPGGVTSGSEFTVAADGTITCNENATQYEFSFLFRFARSGASGVSEIMARLMYAPDGIKANAVQMVGTGAIRIDDADTVWRETAIVRLSPVVGSVIFVELARNNGSDNSGGIGTFQPAGDLSAWAPVSSTSVEIAKYVVD